MSQAYAHAHTASSSGPEYAVYIYHHPENLMEGQNDWEMRVLTPDLKNALEKARSLYESRGYRMVEVKKRAMDMRTARMQDQTLKVFDHGAHGPGQKTRSALGAAFSAAAMFMAGFLKT